MEAEGRSNEEDEKVVRRGEGVKEGTVGVDKTRIST